MTKCIIVAEAGLCHLGDLEEAKNLCLIAKSAGCHYIKFQKRSPPFFATPENERNNDRDTPWKIRMNTLEYRNKLEFNKNQYNEIDNYCKTIGIKWAASVWDIDSVDFLSTFDLDLIKIPSAKITDLELLEYVHKLFKNKTIVLSSGMSNLNEIEDAIYLIDTLDSSDYSQIGSRYLLSCNSTYPINNLKEINLRRIKTLNTFFSHWNIGWSDHSYLLHTTISAVALGATMVEKHICRTKYGIIHPDAQASVLPWGLQKMCNGIFEIQEAMGDGKIEVYDSELPIRKKLRGN